MRRLLSCAIRRAREDAGVMLVELLVVISMLALVVGATLAMLQTTTAAQNRDQAYAQEITTSTASLARLAHDLRQSTQIVSAGPNSVEFYMPATVSDTTVVYDIKYVCTAADSRGVGFTRCARLQSTYPATLPSIPATASSTDIVHVTNGNIATYCTSNGAAPSGSVFFYQNAAIADTNPSPPPCDESYVARVALSPTYVQLRIAVPASGDLASAAHAMTHTTVLQNGVYMRNLDNP
jgi:type II secretory pathway pseudopilin PulG